MVRRRFTRTPLRAPTVCSPAQAQAIRRAIEAIRRLQSGHLFRDQADNAVASAGFRACSSHGWTPRSAIGWSRRESANNEVQALWLNAWIGAQQSPRWEALFNRGLDAFRESFWNDSRRCLFDVIDCNHQKGTRDASLRPNQIFAVGGLPISLLEGETAHAVVEAVESLLITPKGLRSLAPSESNYRAHYQGDVVQRTPAITREPFGRGSVDPSSKPGCVCTAPPSPPSRTRAVDSCRLFMNTSRKPVWGMFRRLRMLRRLSSRAAAPSKHGRWASFSASNIWFCHRARLPNLRRMKDSITNRRRKVALAVPGL